VLEQFFWGDFCDNYHELIEKYGRYKTDSESLYNQYISNPVDTIIDTDIHQLEQQDATRKLFQTLQDSCRGIVGFITQNMSEIDVEVEAFNTLVDEYVKTIPDLRNRLLACIQRSSNDAGDKVRTDYHAIYPNNLGILPPASLDPLVHEGDALIDDIERLLAELDADA